MTAVRDSEAVVLWKECVFLIAARLRQCRRVFLVIYIRNALEEEQREDVSLEIRSIHWAAKDIGSFPEVGFERAERRAVIRHVFVGSCLRQGRAMTTEARMTIFHVATFAKFGRPI